MGEQRIKDYNPERWQHIETIMLVDDNDDWCFISKRLLNKAGFEKEIITAQNGLEALNILTKKANNGERLPELIFLDIKMPVMDGFEFLEEITKSAKLDLSSTRIFICSSSLYSKDKERASLYPVSGYITKPLTQEILNDILK